MNEQNVTMSVFNSAISQLIEQIRALSQKMDAGFELIAEKFAAIDEKIDFRFDTLSNRMDAMSLQYTPRLEHKKLEERVTLLEQR